MSGPKVVRIVTREEIIAICEQHLARLEAAIARWTISGLRHDTITEAEITEVQQRHDQLRALLAADAFVELQKAVPEEIAFLDADTQSRLARAVERGAAERTRRRRRASAAKTVLAELRASGKHVPSELSASLEAIVSGAAVDQDAEGAFAKAFALFDGNGPANTVSEQTRDIAVRLGAGERPTSLAEWRTTILDKEPDHRLVRVDGLIAELHVIDEEAGAVFVRRLSQISGEPAAARANLLVDSLIADLAEATRKARERSDLGAKLRAQLAEIKRFSSTPAQTLAADMEAALAALDISGVDRLLAAAAAQVKAEINRIAAEARRQAILQGLSSLGYEVRDGMATSFAKGEAVVMQHARTPGFGLEVSGPPEAQRLQMRVVAFGSPGSPRDSSRDRDIELQWCGDFDKLQDMVGRVGGEIAIERSVVAGSQPLKVIAGHQHDRIDPMIAQPRPRTQGGP
jgi:hypothetical protein